MKIYCVEDEEEIRNLIIYALTSVGYEVEGFSESAPFWDRIKDNQPDLILLDIMMPGIDGLEVCTLIRQKYSCPLIFISALSEEETQLKAFEKGADDYIAKPFLPSVLYAKCYAICKREAHTQNNIKQFQDL